MKRIILPVLVMLSLLLSANDSHAQAALYHAEGFTPAEANRLFDGDLTTYVTFNNSSQSIEFSVDQEQQYISFLIDATTIGEFYLYWNGSGGYSDAISIDSNQLIVVEVPMFSMPFITATIMWGTTDFRLYEISDGVLHVPDLTPPAVPTGLSATPGNGEVTLNWAANSEPDLAGYNVYRDGVKITSSPINGTSYTDTGRTNGTTYSYRIRAIDASNNESALSVAVTATPIPGPDTTPPAVPTGLSATPGNGEVTLNWAANSEPDLAGYDVYRDGVKITSSPINGTSYTDTGRTNGTTYSYRIRAIDTSDNESSLSLAVSATPTEPTANPIIPQNVSAKPGTNRIIVNWSAVEDATSYIVYRNGVMIATVNGTQYIDEGVQNGSSYTYTIKSVVDGSESDPSNPATTKAGQIIEYPDSINQMPGVLDVIKSAFSFAGMFAPYIILILSLLLVVVLVGFVIWLISKLKRPEWEQMDRAELRARESASRTEWENIEQNRQEREVILRSGTIGGRKARNTIRRFYDDGPRYGFEYQAPRVARGQRALPLPTTDTRNHREPRDGRSERDGRR